MKTHLGKWVQARMPQDGIRPGPRASALQHILPRICGEKLPLMAGDVLAHLPQRRVPWRRRKRPLQHLQPETDLSGLP